MAGLLYFVPKAQAESPAMEASGLASVIGGLSRSTVQVFGFEGVGDGLLIQPHPASLQGVKPDLRYRRDAQAWRECADGKYWVGWEIERSPRPCDLARKEMIDGHNVLLGDEQEWLIPVARLFWGGTALPQSLILGPGGKVVTEALPEFAGLSADAEKVWAKFSAERLAQGDEGPQEDAPSLTVDEGFRIAVAALSLNYAIGPNEVAALRLLTTANYREILQALIDVPTLVRVSLEMAEASKKNGSVTIPAGSSSGHGAADSLPDTSPLLQTVSG
jgi:hypothetical protein